MTADRRTSDDFLGRLWVPVTLIIAIGLVVGSLAADEAVVGFIAVASVVALSITARLTWDRRLA